MATTALQRTGSPYQRISPSASPRHRLASYRSLSLSRFERDGFSLANGTDSGTEATEAASRAAIEEFEKDSVFAKFLVDDYNATQFASEALSSGSAAFPLEKLQEGIQLLEKQLRSEVFFRHDELLQQISSLKETESVLTVVRAGAESLQASTQRVRSEIAEPYKQIKAKSRQLASLHDTVELLRSVIRALKQLKKLQELMESSGAKADLAKAAQIYNDIETLRKEAEIAGVEVVDEEIPWLLEVGNQIRRDAMKGLESGMEALNQAERSGAPQGAGASKARESLWQRIGACMDQLHSIVVAAWHLQRVLSKKRDPISHIRFLDEVMQAGDPMLTEQVWEALVNSFGSQMKSAFTASSFVKEIFVMGYPKLLGLIDSLVERLFRDTDVKGVPPAIKAEAREQLIAALEPFQTAFLGKSLARLSDFVNSIFPIAARGSLPTQEHITRLVSHIHEELDATKSDKRLTLLVLHEVSKVLHLFAEKAECQTFTGLDIRQVTGPITPQQLKNFTLCLYLQDVHARISSMLVGLPTVAPEVLSASLGAVYGVASDCITPLFKAIVEKLESYILQIHDQSFASEDNVGDDCSKYMEEVQKLIVHFQSEFLWKLLPGSLSAAGPVAGQSIPASLARRMASRVLLFWVRHAAMVRPLSESGKLQLIHDISELELVVGQTLFPVEQLGSPYRALRAFRPLLFLKTSEFASNPLLQELPPSVILDHLYSRAPEELESPMRQSKLSPQQYSLWLDSQGEEQAWKGIKATLDEYAAKVKARGDKEFSPIYLLMLQLGTLLIEGGQA
jgi:hypothetical protein